MLPQDEVYGERSQSNWPESGWSQLSDLVFSDHLHLKAYIPPASTKPLKTIAFDIDLESYQKQTSLPTSEYLTLPPVTQNTTELSTTMLRIYLKGLPSFIKFTLYEVVRLPTAPGYTETDTVDRKLCEVSAYSVDIIAEYTYPEHMLRNYRKTKESGMTPVLLGRTPTHNEIYSMPGDTSQLYRTSDILTELSRHIKHFKAVFELDDFVPVSNQEVDREVSDVVNVDHYTLVVNVVSRVEVKKDIAVDEGKN